MDPILKYPGGKRKILHLLTENLPEGITALVEPFCGAGTLSFKLLPSVNNIYLNDFNAPIISLYLAVKHLTDSEFNSFISDIKNYFNNNSEEHYYECRKKYNSLPMSIEKAALLIYINRTCFNGLYRVNSEGNFNVPYGHYKSVDYILPIKLLQEARTLFKDSNISAHALDFRFFLEIMKEKTIPETTLVYLDPPYYDSYSMYTSQGFSHTDHEDLAKEFKNLSDSGYKVMLSNSHCKEVYSLYNNFSIESVVTQRTIARSLRPIVSEVLVRNF